MCVYTNTNACEVLMTFTNIYIWQGYLFLHDYDHFDIPYLKDTFVLANTLHVSRDIHKYLTYGIHIFYIYNYLNIPCLPVIFVFFFSFMAMMFEIVHTYIHT